jgi:6-phosphofructokinase 1
MNAAVRAVVRTALFHGIKVDGILQGYTGLALGRFLPLEMGSVANIIQRGGTILKAGRCLEFHQTETRKTAAENARRQGIDALVCIGGDGSFKGAQALMQEHSIRIVGIPGTIDNDIFGTDNTLGFDTAVNTAMEAIDRLRDTAASHDRLFIVEVMGRNSGFIAIDVGLAGGAEEVFIPDVALNLDQVIDRMRISMQRGKLSSILVTAEGQKPGRAYDLADQLRKRANLDAKVCILGHIQRGGSPTAADRLLGSRMGAAAVELLRNNEHGFFVGTDGPRLKKLPFAEAGKVRHVDRDLIELTRILSR